jgi:hypothetical protein
MDAQEHKAWSDYMKASKGKWRIDPIHDGSNGMDFIAFRCDLDDETRGVYVMVDGERDASKGRTVRAGKFTDAIPHLTEGAFTTEWAASFPAGRNDAMAFVIERLGVGFLLNAVCGSPAIYR